MRLQGWAYVALCGALAGVLAGCGRNSVPPDTKAADETQATQDDGSLKTGSPAPGFTLQTPDGVSVRLSDGAGQVQLIDFWATWCAPCREEIPMLADLQATYGERGFRVLGIAEEEPSVLRDFAAAQPLRYTSLVGTADVFESYGVLSLPTAYLIDREGRIVELLLGPKPRKVLESKIQKLL
jgi:peroxiredoxin